MNNVFVKRKREALSKSTLELEKAQAAIKAIVKNGILRFQSWDTVNRAVGRVVEKYTKDLEEGEFKIRAQQSLYNYATLQWRKLRQDFVGLNLSLLPAVLAFTSSKSSDRARKKAADKIIQETPQLEYMTEPSGRYWDTAQPLQEFSKDYMKRVKKGFYELANSEAKDSYSDRVSLRNIAEMNERFKQKEEDLGKLIASGEDLVWISTHGNCSERCEPWQGRLYSISGRSGEIDGIKFQPLSNATDIYYTTKAGKTYKNGCISGFNCRHVLIPYRKGNKPIEIPAEEIERDREINNTQRDFEVRIRKARALSIGLKEIDPVEASRYGRESKELYRKYIDYSKKNDVAYYPSRCEVFDGEELINASYRKVIETKREV